MTWLGSVLLISLALARADEPEKLPADVPLDKVPRPVMDAVKTRFAGATVTEASKELDGKKLVYELSLKLKDQTIDVILTPEGEILVFEKSITAKDLPEPVAEILADKYPKATYRVLEEFYKVQDKKETLAFYEAKLITVEKKDLEVKVTAAGKIISEKEATPD
jgi:hypothetical protein